MKKLLLGSLLAAAMVLPAQSAEPPKPAPAPAAAPAAPAPAAPASAPKTKEVCKDVKGKDGKTTKQCKQVKVHKKLDGKKVPDAKK